MRNIKEYAAKGEKKCFDTDYDLTIGELMAIVSLPGVYERICMAYNAGFEAGTRYQRNQAKGKEKSTK